MNNKHLPPAKINTTIKCYYNSDQITTGNILAQKLDAV